jgi:hypothetical protein
MASPEERQHAQRLLKIHRRNLERLEVRRAEIGGETNLALDNQIDEERANIAALEPLTKPPPSPKVQEFVSSASGGEIDLAMLFIQGTQINARVTQVEQQNVEQSKQNQAILEEQGLSRISRMHLKEAVDDLVTRFSASEQARKAGAKWYRITLLALFALIVLHYFGVW